VTFPGAHDVGQNRVYKVRIVPEQPQDRILNVSDRSGLANEVHDQLLHRLMPYRRQSPGFRERMFVELKLNRCHFAPRPNTTAIPRVPGAKTW
jgi:hypothetical protein